MSRQQKPRAKSAEPGSAPDHTNPQTALFEALDTKEPDASAGPLRLLSTALNAAANSVVITDRDGHILWVNLAFATISGYSRTEVLGKTPRLLKSGTHDPEFYENLWRTILCGKVWAGEITNRRKDGTLYTDKMTITPVRDSRGQISHFIGIKEDVTQFKSLEEQFRQAQKMEAIGRLAGSVAHDFNNLLCVMNGYSELALDGPIDEVQQSRLKEILKAGQRAAALTRQLLAFSRKKIIFPRVLDLNATVADVDNLLRRLIGEDINLKTILDPKLARIKADPAHVEQVLTNLAVNARDAMPKGGELTIKTQNAILDESFARAQPGLKPGSWVQLEVSDTGIGMNPETTLHIFEPFFTTKQDGTGLGLATVYGIVRQAHGHVWVSSELNKGTTFTICFPPAGVGVNPTIAKSTPRPMPKHPATVLLVEDDDSLRGFVAETLRTQGYDILVASNASDGFSMFKHHHIDLLLTDVVMPGMNGCDFAELALKMQPDLGVLLMSGYTGREIVYDDIQAGGFVFIQKPFGSYDLAAKVVEILDRRNIP